MTDSAKPRKAVVGVPRDLVESLEQADRDLAEGRTRPLRDVRADDSAKIHGSADIHSGGEERGGSESAANDPVLRDFTGYIADLVTSGIASRQDCPDFVIDLPEDNRRAYFDVEAGEVFVITVERGRIEVAS